MNADAQPNVPLPCPQCGAPMPAGGRYCGACGADLYPKCPRCDQARQADDASCRTCGYDFKVKKLRLRDPIAAAPDAGPADGVPILTIHQMLPGADRRRRRAADVAAGAFLRGAVKGVLLLAAGALVVDWGWTRVTGRNLAAVLLRSGAASAGAAVSLEDQEPDWEALCAERKDAYRAHFKAPPVRAEIAVVTAAGVRQQGTLVALDAESVRLQVGAQQLEFPRLVLNPETRSRLFAEDYADQTVALERTASEAAWRAAVAARQAAGAVAPLWNPRASLVANGIEWGRRLVSGAPPPERPDLSALPLRAPLSAPGAPAVPPLPYAPAAPPAAGPGGPDATAAGADSVRSFLDISCPVCHGKGVLQSSSRSGDRRSRLAAPQQNTPCPVCQGRGGRHVAPPDFPWPAGAERCRTCGGMGHVLKQDARRGSLGADRPMARLCPECDGRGYRVNPQEAQRQTPPRYD